MSSAETLETLRRKAARCTACDLYKRATRTVFGEGPPHASLMLVGEQPGHEEDLAGRPFVGPAGRLLDQALAKAELDRRRIYITNVVKHFKWKAGPGGKRRIHERPNLQRRVSIRETRGHALVSPGHPHLRDHPNPDGAEETTR